MLSASEAVSNCRRIVLAVLGCAALLGAPTPVAVHAVNYEHTAGDVVKAFYRAVCAHDDPMALTILMPVAPVVHVSWSGDGRGERVDVISMRQVGREHLMLDTLRFSACLPLDNLRAEGTLATWQQTLWREGDHDHLGEQTLRWHSRATVEDGQLAALIMAQEQPNSGLPPPPLPVTIPVAPGRASVSVAGGPLDLRHPQAVPTPLAQPTRPHVSISVGPTEAAWPVIGLGVTGVVLLIGLGGRRRVRLRPPSLTRSTTCIWRSVGLSRPSC